MEQGATPKPEICMIQKGEKEDCVVVICLMKVLLGSGRVLQCAAGLVAEFQT